MLNRLILVLSLLGMVLAVHLWIQKARGFDQGCLGLEKPAEVRVAEVGCNAGGLEAASHLLGVSNAAWSYAFFFGLSLVSFAKVVVPGTWARRLHWLSEIAIVPVTLYAGYLVLFQAFVAHAYCVLCLTTAALIAAIFCLHAAVRFRGGYRPVAESAQSVEMGYAGGALFGAVGLLLAVLLFVDRLGTRPLDQGNSLAELNQVVGQALPIYIDGKRLSEMRACHFDWDAKRIDAEDICSPDTPFLGKPGGIPVVIFFDPNCPHCRDYYPDFLALADKFKDRARFYILPRMLWRFSLSQIEALELARREGKYFEMWQLQFATRHRGGMEAADLEVLFRKLGLPTDGLASRLDAVKPGVMAELARANAAGIDATPAIFIDGLKVFPYNQSPECVDTLINRRIAADWTADVPVAPAK
jgi:uncharacterized membrane protein